MRFDDSLDTVLRADRSTPAGAQAAWRQLVDLIGRRRAADTPEAIARLDDLRSEVPLAARAASARGLERADPPAALVRLLAVDALPVAAPVLRAARLPYDDWLALLPRLSPAGRAVLRHRRDLPGEVVRALDQYGPTDFLIEPRPDAAADSDDLFELIPEAAEPAPGSATSIFAPEAMVATENPAPAAPVGPYHIADVVARIEAFQRNGGRDAVAQARAAPTSFRFETDASGAIRWIEGIAREALIGLSLDPARPAVTARLDGVAAGGFRRRARFADARLEVGGAGEAAGSWRVSAVPAFDRISGRFTGYRGTARRPRSDQQATRGLLPGDPAVLRQLLHELRTPTTAIIGFAEMIEGEMVGPVDDTSRTRAGTIRDETRALLGALDDLEIAARLEGDALRLDPATVPLDALFGHVGEELRSLTALRGAHLRLPDTLGPEAALAADPRAATRLVTRLVAALVSAARQGETLTVTAERRRAAWQVAIGRPEALAGLPVEALLTAEDDGEDPALLGLGFALRLAGRLTAELRGALNLEGRMVTLMLPAAVTARQEAVYQHP